MKNKGLKYRKLIQAALLLIALGGLLYVFTQTPEASVGSDVSARKIATAKSPEASGGAGDSSAKKPAATKLPEASVGAGDSFAKKPAAAKSPEASVGAGDSFAKKPAAIKSPEASLSSDASAHKPAAVKSPEASLSADNSFAKKPAATTASDNLNPYKFVRKESSVFALSTLSQSHSNQIKSEQAKSAYLAIIIDDVASKQQASQIAELIKSGVVLTPSFLPPNVNHPHTAQLAKQFGQNFMLHLPLEAKDYAHPEPDTLLLKTPCEQVKKRLDELFAAFSGLEFVNNHTGSRFTANKAAMRCLFEGLKAHNARFIDSRTIAFSVAPALSKEFNWPYVHRNVFLDNLSQEDEIKQVLNKACELAKKKRFVIAIGHPHPDTLKALRGFACFNGVKLLYVKQLYKRILKAYNAGDFS